MLQITGKMEEMLPDGSTNGFMVYFEESFQGLVLKGNKLLPIEYKDKPLSEIITVIDDDIYQKKYTQKAENEKFNLLGTKIAEVDDAIGASKTQASTSQKTLMDMVFLFYSKGLLTDEDMASFTLD